MRRCAVHLQGVQRIFQILGEAVAQRGSSFGRRSPGDAHGVGGDQGNGTGKAATWPKHLHLRKKYHLRGEAGTLASRCMQRTSTVLLDAGFRQNEVFVSALLLFARGRLPAAWIAAACRGIGSFHTTGGARRRSSTRGKPKHRWRSRNHRHTHNIRTRDRPPLAKLAGGRTHKSSSVGTLVVRCPVRMTLRTSSARRQGFVYVPGK